MRSTRLFGSGSGHGDSRAPRAGSRATRLGAAGVALVAALGLGGCQITSPVETDRHYEPADGSSVSIGGIDVKNVVVVSEGSGAAGTVTGLVVNHTDQAATVSVPDEGGRGEEIKVPAKGSVNLEDGEGGGPVVIASVPEKAGATKTLTIVTTSGQTVVNAPVLEPRSYYATLAPSAAATATATGTASGTATPAAEPTATTEAATDTPTAEQTPEPTSTATTN